MHQDAKIDVPHGLTEAGRLVLRLSLERAGSTDIIRVVTMSCCAHASMFARWGESLTDRKNYMFADNTHTHMHMYCSIKELVGRVVMLQYSSIPTSRDRCDEVKSPLQCKLLLLYVHMYTYTLRLAVETRRFVVSKRFLFHRHGR